MLLVRTREEDRAPHSSVVMLKKNVMYQEQWDEYKKRRRIFILVWLLYLPVAGGIALFFKKMFGSEELILPVVFAWMVFFLIAGLRMTFWKCPKCGNSFFFKFSEINIFPQKCVHCGLKKWALSE